MTNSSWSVADSRRVYNISEWSEGFFDINEAGALTVSPNLNKAASPIELSEVVDAAIQAGLALPILVRFDEILTARVQALHQAFSIAMQTQDYQSHYQAIYPIKVNQQRRVIESVLAAERGQVGLEAGSKPELLAVLGLAETSGTTIICNGYKDREYIRLALIGQQLGFKVYIIIEKLAELRLVLEEAEQRGVEPLLGMRVRLASIAKGKWQNTGGARGKFGLTASQVLQAIEQLKQQNQLHCLQLLHFHMGSQVSNIRDIQSAVQECARFYAELRRLNVPIHCVDVGGGLGVDYEGTCSRNFCSMNYRLQSYADHVVQAFTDICEQHDLPHPSILSESGRAIAAHHAVLITDVIDEEAVEHVVDVESAEANESRVAQELWQLYDTLQSRTLVEGYHDANYWLSEAKSLYSQGVISLPERARIEQLHLALCRKIQELINPDYRAHREIADSLNLLLAKKLFVNFSLFQSIPDSWAIDQIIPILPLAGLDEKPTQRVIIQDLTCDSDGRVNHYVDGHGIETSLPLPNVDKPLLGFFMVGAYQEILGDKHNLFGDTDSVHVVSCSENGFILHSPMQGETVTQVLQSVNIESEELLANYEQCLNQSDLDETTQQEILECLAHGLNGYTYFEE